MTPEQDKAVKAEIAYAMDETKPAMTDAQKDLMASYQLMMHVGNANWENRTRKGALYNYVYYIYLFIF